MRPEPPESWADLPFFTQDWPLIWDQLVTLPAWQPAPDTIFRALALTPRQAVRVVILGQDPYPTRGRATGLAFAFPPDTAPRDSLRNILAEMQADTGHQANPTLEGLARQGVLLLNTVLTVPVDQTNGHAGLGWEELAGQVLQAVAADGPRAFLLWGKIAQKRCRALPREGHLFIETAHPSPLSARLGFNGSRPFSRVNDWLVARGQRPIDWGA